MTVSKECSKEWWHLDSQSWKNSRDFAPSCRKCSGHTPRDMKGWRCQECQGTGADAVPWSELFRNARLK